MNQIDIYALDLEAQEADAIRDMIRDECMGHDLVTDPVVP